MLDCLFSQGLSFRPRPVILSPMGEESRPPGPPRGLHTRLLQSSSIVRMRWVCLPSFPHPQDPSMPKDDIPVPAR